MQKRFLTVDLQLFSDGAGDGAAAATTAATTTATTTATTGDTGASANGQQTTGDKPAKVVYGKQAQAAEIPEQGEQTQEATAPTPAAEEITPEQRKAKFQELINGEYKGEFTAHFQEVFDKRFKEQKTIEERMQGQQQLIDVIAQKYNLDGTDLKALATAMEKDDRMWADAAEDAGMSVEQYKQFTRLQRENASMRSKAEQAQKEQAARANFEKWKADAESFAKTYPGVDLSAQLKNPQVTQLLRAGLDISTAYRVVNIDSITQAASAEAAKAAEQATVDNIKARGARPSEAGTTSAAGVVVKNDVSKLTKDDLKDIAERVRRGEKITF